MLQISVLNRGNHGRSSWMQNLSNWSKFGWVVELGKPASISQSAHAVNGKPSAGLPHSCETQRDPAICSVDINFCVSLFRPPALFPLHLYGQHQVHSSRMSYTMDALFTKGILRALRTQIFIHPHLFTRFVFAHLLTMSTITKDTYWQICREFYRYVWSRGA